MIDSVISGQWVNNGRSSPSKKPTHINITKEHHQIKVYQQLFDYLVQIVPCRQIVCVSRRLLRKTVPTKHMIATSSMSSYFRLIMSFKLKKALVHWFLQFRRSFKNPLSILITVCFISKSGKWNSVPQSVVLGALLSYHR